MCEWGQFNIEHLHCDPSDCYISATSGILKTGYFYENSLSWILKPLRLTIKTTCCDTLLTKGLFSGKCTNEPSSNGGGKGLTFKNNDKQDHPSWI